MSTPHTHWTAAIATLRARIDAVFDALLERTRLDASGLRARPRGGGWSGIEVLEHVALTNRFLLVLADKIARKSLARAARGASWPASAPSFARLEQLAGREWSAPEHRRLAIGCEVRSDGSFGFESATGITSGWAWSSAGRAWVRYD